MIILAIVLLILFGVIAFFNTEMILIDLYFITFTVPMWLAFIGVLLIGIIIAALFASAKGARNRQVIKNKDKELERSETERKEAVDRMKQESEIQLEMQKKEAEIQRLNAEFTSTKDNEPEITGKVIKSEVPIDIQGHNNSDKNVDIQEYKIDLPEEN
jgi:putative membrane protein